METLNYARDKRVDRRDCNQQGIIPVYVYTWETYGWTGQTMISMEDEHNREV